MGPTSTAYLWAMPQVLAKLNSEGHGWLVGGDWNNEPAALFSTKWATAASAIPFVPDTPTCRRATPGTALDYSVVSTNLAFRVASH
eukprot:5180308-Pyramimonas_sp.AAC.1